MKVLFFTVSLFFLLGFSTAQEKFQGGIYGNIGLPVGEFKEAVNNSFGGTGWGVGMNALMNPKKIGEYSPVFIGIEGNYMNLGTEKTPESFYLPQLKTTYNYFNVGPLIRVFLSNREEGFTPFLDGFVGLKVLNSLTKIDNTLVDTILDQEYLESLLSTNFEGLGYGLGLGFFNRKINDGLNKVASVQLRLMYLYGDRINYVKRGSIKVDKDGEIQYETERTKTSMVVLQIGIIF